MDTPTAMKKRGWTEQLIASLLGEPDDIKPNPHYRSGPAMKLYSSERVEEAEKSPEFIAAQEGRKARREAVAKSRRHQAQKIQDYLDSLEITVPAMGKNKLMRLAQEHYDDRRQGDDYYDGGGDQEAFIARICVNYLRHELTSYEAHLAKVAGKVGASEAYLKIKEKVLDAIGEVYPWLLDECFRQQQRMCDAYFNEIP